MLLKWVSFISELFLRLHTASRHGRGGCTCGCKCAALSTLGRIAPRRAISQPYIYLFLYLFLLLCGVITDPFYPHGPDRFRAPRDRLAGRDVEIYPRLPVHTPINTSQTTTNTHTYPKMAINTHAHTHKCPYIPLNPHKYPIAPSFCPCTSLT